MGFMGRVEFRWACGLGVMGCSISEFRVQVVVCLAYPKEHVCVQVACTLNPTCSRKDLPF